MSITEPTIRATLLIVTGIVGLGIPLDASSRPKRIRAGDSYYSDELAEPTNQGLVRALGPEKNYEEVYQFYAYYEVVYDEDELAVLFREYKRGEVIRTEAYRYDDSGLLVMRIVALPGKEDEVTVVEAADSLANSNGNIDLASTWMSSTPLRVGTLLQIPLVVRSVCARAFEI